MAAGPVIRFDGWTLDGSAGELSRPGHPPIRLQWQSLQVLLELLAAPGQLVTREQLIARLWPTGVVVTYDTALNTAIRRLRVVLDDHADAPRYIETIPKRGYRFIGLLEAAESPSPTTATVATVAAAVGNLQPAPSAQRRRLVAGAALLALVVLIVGLRAWRDESAAVAPEVTASQNVDGVPAAARARLQQGRFLLQRRGPGDVARARGHFEAALAMHPSYARAWSGIASTWWLDVVEGRIAEDAGLARLQEAARHALAIDPGTAEAHLRLANLATLRGDRAVYEAHLGRAAAVAPSDPLVLAFQASDAEAAGDFERAVDLHRRALDADPLSLATRYNLAVSLYVAGRFRESREQFEAWLELNPADRAGVDMLVGHTLVLQGEYAAALELGERAADPIVRMQLRALALHGLGRSAEAGAALEELRATVGGRRSYLLAEALAFRDEPDAAFASLHAAVAAADEPCRSRDCWPVHWLDDLPLLGALRTDPRWAEWVTTLAAAAPG